MHTGVRWLISILISLIWTALIAFTIDYLVFEYLFLLIAIFITGTLFLGFIVTPKVIPYIKQCKRILIILIFCSLISLIILLLLNIRFDNYYRLPDTNIRILATGEKNEESFSPTVRIVEIFIDELPLDLRVFSFAQGWHFADGILFSDAEVPSEFYVNIAAGRQVLITFWQSHYSGIAEISSDSGQLLYDLYTEEEYSSIVIHDLSELVDIQVSLKLMFQYAIFYLLQFVLIFICVFYVVSLHKKPEKKEDIQFERE